MQSGLGKIGKSFQGLGDKNACENPNTGGVSQSSGGGMKEVLLKRCVVASSSPTLYR